MLLVLPCLSQSVLCLEFEITYFWKYFDPINSNCHNTNKWFPGWPYWYTSADTKAMITVQHNSSDSLPACLRIVWQFESNCFNNFKICNVWCLKYWEYTSTQHFRKAMSISPCLQISILMPGAELLFTKLIKNCLGYFVSVKKFFFLTSNTFRVN